MKSFTVILAALAATAIAAPVVLPRNIASIRRSVSDEDVAASVNYILVLEKETSSKMDAYQDEVDAVSNPADVLGRRSVSDEDVAASVNYILVLEKETSSKMDAYQDEVDAVANPADVLGRRSVSDEDVAASVNYSTFMPILDCYAHEMSSLGSRERDLQQYGCLPE